MRNINDKVTVRNFVDDKKYEGRITNVSGHGHRRMYQVLMNNEQKSHWWFGCDEVFDFSEIAA